MITRDEEQIARVMRDIMAAISNFDLNLTPPETGRIIHRIIRHQLNAPDPYRHLKIMSNQRALALEECVRGIIRQSGHPFETAVKFAIAGNILDFGMKSSWDEDLIMSTFDKTQRIELNREMIQELYHAASNAQRILVLGDNAGETVFDRLMIENFPGTASVFYAVKASPVINDATMTEAIESGLDRVATLISTGDDGAGTVLKNGSAEFVDCYRRADLIIAKGQANFETLSDSTDRIYFLLQIKCPVIGHHYGYPLGTWLVTSTWAKHPAHHETNHAVNHPQSIHV